MLKNKKLSIIIPVYNVEKYLNNCIDSILNQTYKDYEIILIDDGSKDNSPSICDDYAKKYENIKVIHKANGGLSSARNAGIRNASGEFLMFIDSDDFLYDYKCLEKLSDHFAYDVIQYKMIYYYEKKKKYVELKRLNVKEDTYLNQLKELVENDIFSVSACNKIIRKDIIVTNNIYFDETLLSEDIDWSLSLYLKACSIKLVDENVYVYRQQREGSITSKMKPKNIQSLYYIINKWINYNYNNDLIKDIYFNYLSYQWLILVSNINKTNCDKNLKKDIYKFKYLMDYGNNKKANMCKKLFKIFGYNAGVLILKFYILLKNKGLLKI